jgi:hypothetical protein
MQQPEQQEVNKEALKAELYEKLTKPFPAEALTSDTSRGFALTSIKAQYVVERLNKVFGADGWEAKPQVLFNDKESGCGVQLSLVARYPGLLPIARHVISGSKAKKDPGDLLKSAMTDALCKAASHLGIGNEVYKGNVKPPGSSPAKKKSGVKPADTF